MSGWAAAAQIAAQIGGDLLKSGLSAHEAKEQRDFQENMSNTSYVRAMADMRNAGLNPMLAAKVGGADTPSGAMGQTGGEFNVGKAVTSAMGAQQMSAQTDNIRVNTDKAAAETENVRADTVAKEKRNEVFDRYLANLESSTQSNIASAGQSDAQTRSLDRNAELTAAQVSNVRADTDSKRQAILESIARIRSMNMSNQQTEVAIAKLKAEIAGQLTDNEAKALGLSFEKQFGERFREANLFKLRKEGEGLHYGLPRKSREADFYGKDYGPGSIATFLREFGLGGRDLIGR